MPSARSRGAAAVAGLGRGGRVQIRRAAQWARGRCPGSSRAAPAARGRALPGNAGVGAGAGAAEVRVEQGWATPGPGELG